VIDIISTILAQNSAKTDPDAHGFTDDPLNHNLIGQPALLGPLGFHDGGFTQTLLPSPQSLAVVNTPGLNPDSLTTDQNGKPFQIGHFIGAVQTTT
jgi:hypothetical protein